ncbi:hypothetical protein K491DRAFT_594063 [Lophiostoma macrostomum CBS 122681]|uniref:Uncharacterized protein n=1 Tax=Lophiostoma macrostomum CBS 122681 TaxID=1314788 RepID=A0A6A6TDF9_9PLEO|nr:hypothetical protein K491DRAFT_594063 [Lophiostoma macrostomum CBS 122681]
MKEQRRSKIVSDVSRTFTTMLCPPPKHKLYLVKGEYQYRLGDSTLPLAYQQDDPLIRFIIRTIRRLTIENMYIAASKIRVSNATNSPPLWPVNLANVQCNIKFYTFTMRLDEFPITVPISIMDRTIPLKSENVVVRSYGTWKPLEAWLLGVTEYMDCGSTRSLSSQRIWWERNGKTFRLMDLPAEVRANVFEHILGSPIYLRTALNSSTGQNVVTFRPGKGAADYHSTIHWENSYAYEEAEKFPRIATSYSKGRNVRLANMNIFLVNKQIRDEALKSGWEGTWKHFSLRYILKDVLQCPNPPTEFNWLSRIELHLSASGFIGLFGVEVYPEIHIDASCSYGHLLQRILNLKQLRLRFRSPYDGPQANPWRDYVQHRRYADVIQSDPRCKDMVKFPCQRILVDYILTFAFPFIKHVPNIYLAGCIKSKQKADWDRIFATEYYERSKDYRTHGYDQDAALEQILGTPVYE